MTRVLAKWVAATGVALVAGGLGTSVLGFGFLHTVEFGPAGYLCPAYVCTIDTLFRAGYGWALVLSYGGIVMAVAGFLALGAALFIRPRD